jgi:hypothetical protein
MYEMLQEVIVYMDIILRKRAATSANETIMEIRLSASPYPEIEEGDTADSYRRKTYEYMRSSIELCLLDSESASGKKLIELWEPCAFACMLTVQGTEVMVCNKTRFSPEHELNRHFDGAYNLVSKTTTDYDYRVYSEFSRMLSESREGHEIGTGESPPIRNRTFRKDHEEFIKQMGLDDL